MGNSCPTCIMGSSELDGSGSNKLLWAVVFGQGLLEFSCGDTVHTGSFLNLRHSHPKERTDPPKP